MSRGLALFVHRIDEQLCDLLIGQVSSALEEAHGGLSEQFKPEIRLVVLAMFYSLSLLNADANHEGSQGLVGRNLGSQLHFGSDTNKSSTNNTRSIGSFTAKDGTKTTIKIVGASVKPIAASRQSIHSSDGKDCLHMSTPGMQALGMHSQSSPLVDVLVTHLRALLSPFNCAEPLLQRRTYQLCAIVAYLLSTYALERAQRQDLLQGWAAAAPGTLRHRLHRLVRLADAVAKVADVGNLGWFLYRGGYPSLLYRWAGMGLAPNGDGSNLPQPPLPPSPGYSSAQLYVKSRHLLWDVLSALLAAGTAAVDWRAVLGQCRVLVLAAASTAAPAVGVVRRRVLAIVRQVVSVVLLLRRRGRESLRTLPVLRRLVTDGDDRPPAWLLRLDTATNNGSHPQDGAAAGVAHAGLVGDRGHRGGALRCTLCSNSPPEAPHCADCGHVFCYVCLRTKVPLPPSGHASNTPDGTDGATQRRFFAPWNCPSCQTPATTCVRWNAQ